MIMSKYPFLFALGFLLISGPSVWAQAHKGINFQAVVKSPAGRYPTTDANLTAVLQILTPGNCVLREEVHSSVKLTNGYLNLVLGTGAAVGGLNPTPILTLPQVFDNATSRTGLTCLDSDSNIVSTGTDFHPQAWQARKLRLRVNVPDEGMLVADFNLRAVPFAINAETLNGKTENDFVRVSSNIQQTAVENFFSSVVVGQLLNGTYKAPAVADGSVSEQQLSSASVTSDKLAAASVTAQKLASDIGLWTAAGGHVTRSTGNVGIGIAAPTSLVHIRESTDGWESSLRMDRSWDSATDYFQMMYDYEGLKFRTADDGDDKADIIFKPKNVEAVRIRDNGYVGIGASVPARKLDIVSSDDATYVRIKGISDGDTFSSLDFESDEATDKRWELSHGAGTNLNKFNLKFYNGTSWSFPFNITPAGSVGIGTASPAATLDVNGTIKLAKNSSQPHACDASKDAIIALTANYTTCVCKGASSAWVNVSDGTTACIWN